MTGEPGEDGEKGRGEGRKDSEVRDEGGMEGKWWGEKKDSHQDCLLVYYLHQSLNPKANYTLHAENLQVNKVMK